MYVQRTYNHERFYGKKCCILSQINGFAMVMSKRNSFNWHQKSSLVLFEQFHLFSCKFSSRNSIKKFSMVICTYSVHITIEDFRVRMVDFKPNKWLQLASKRLLQYYLNNFITSAASFRAEIVQKNSLWLYVLMAYI